MSSSLDPQTLAWLDQEDRHTARIIREHGVYLQAVGGDPEAQTPSFVYTVGLFGMAHPELLIFSVHPLAAGSALNDLADRVRAGDDLTPGERVRAKGLAVPLVVEQVPNPADIVFAANRFYQRPDDASVPVYQLTFPDRDGRFPWDTGYSLVDWVQPRPGRFHA